MSDEQAQRYESEWKLGKTIDQTLTEVEWLITEKGPNPYLVEICHALRSQVAHRDSWFANVID